MLERKERRRRKTAQRHNRTEADFATFFDKMLLRNSLSTLHVIVVAVCSFRAGVEAFSQERGVSVCRHQQANLVARRRNLEPVSSQNGRPFIVSYRRVPTGRYGSSGNDKNGWFFRPPVSDSSPSKSQASDQENASRKNSTLATLVKEKAPNEKEGVSKTTNVKIHKPTAWKTKTALSPLAELEDPPRDFLDLQNPQTIFGIAALAGVTAVVGISYSLGLSVEDFVQGAQTLVTDPQAFSQQLIEGVQGLGPTGVIYYALIYMIAEILAIPATPLTLSAGYLFGVQQGILTVLAGATGAACIGFWISRTFLREYVESTLLAPSPSKDGERSPNTLAKLDKAIGEEGFKLLVLIRLSPIFPFSVTNYLYGASSMAFAPYLLGTLIGFVPTTTAYVYTGMVGQALTTGQGGDQPWYVYAGGFTVLAVLVKLVTDVATGIIEAIDDET